MLNFDYSIFLYDAPAEEERRREEGGEEDLHEGALPANQEWSDPFPNRAGEAESQIHEKEANETG